MVMGGLQDCSVLSLEQDSLLPLLHTVSETLNPAKLSVVKTARIHSS